MFDGLITRTPIFNRNLEVFGYELHFCSATALREGIIDDDTQLGECLLRASQALPLDEITGPAPALIRLPPSLLALCQDLAWPKKKIVLEAPFAAFKDQALKNTLSALAETGYAIALNGPCQEFPQLGHGDGFVSIWAANAPTLPTLLQAQALSKAARPPRLLVEGLETSAQCQHFQNLGFDYFEGDFFLHPRLIHGCDLPANRLGLLRLLTRIQSPSISIQEIEDLFRQDLILSYKLLRVINSAYFGMPKRVDSIRRAVLLFGLERIKNWASVVLVNAVDFRPRELLTIALVRARACEALAQDLGLAPSEPYYLAGLFSMLDAIMDASMPQILAQMNLVEALNLALLNGAGIMGEILTTVMAYERGDFSSAPLLHFTQEDIPMRVFLEAIQWADEAKRQMSAA
jgi:EAL and modified HD-GYP domain-containing signal transduction protein